MTDSLFNRLKYFLTGKTITFFVLLVTITGKIIQLIFLFNIRADRSHQILATHSLVTGHGITKGFVYTADLSTTIYEPLFYWPPGYSLLLSPFYVACNYNYIVAGILLDIICAVSLIIVTRKILRTLNVPAYHINLFTLLTGFILYPFFIKMSSDAIAITFFLWALNFTLELLKQDTQHWVQKSIGMGLCLIACASMKFLYVPIIVILPGLLVIKSFIDKNKTIRKPGLLSLLIVFTGVMSLLIYQKSLSGDIAYIAQTKQGLYPENLQSFYPVIPASFINPETVGGALHLPFEAGSAVYFFFQVINIVLGLFLFSFAVWYIKKRGIKNLSPALSFFYILVFVSIVITLLLALLSIRFAKEFDIWTYVQEGRYYGIITVMLQLSLFIFYYYFRNKKGPRARYIFIFLILLFLPEMFRGMLFSANRITNYSKEEYTWQKELKLQQFAEAIIRTELKAKPVTQVILAGSSPYMNNRVCLYSHIPLLKDVITINNPASLNTKNSVLLLVMLRADARKDFEPFLSLRGIKEGGQTEGFYFYTIYVEPH